MENLIVFVVGICAGGFAIWFYMQSRIQTAADQARAEVQVELAASTERTRLLEASRVSLEGEHQALRQQAQQWRNDLDTARDESAKFSERASRVPALEQKLTDADLALSAMRDKESSLRESASRTESQLTAELKAEREQSVEKLALLTEAKAAMTNEFKTIANDILEDKSKRFTAQNQVNIGELLNPLKERMIEFKAKVEEIHNKDTEQQATLKAELTQLKELNRQMTEEAHGLATALKGQAKMQGNWGELVLGNVLDRSGLREGKDFKREVSFNTEEGRKRPDVVIYLPQSKHLVIDAKVSLNAYTRYVNAEGDAERQQALKEHVTAIGSRIQELSDRKYFDLPGLNSPEMVFMFIPIESAFVEALRADETLFQRAIERNVLVATPTTLLTSLNIVRQLWRFEEQNAYTAELADRAGKVYKKLASFLGSMDGVGKQLDKAKESFGTAMGQLYTGKGNLIAQAKEFERLGVSIQIPLPEHLVAKAVLELEHHPESATRSEMETNQA